MSHYPHLKSQYLLLESSKYVSGFALLSSGVYERVAFTQFLKTSWRVAIV